VTEQLLTIEQVARRLGVVRKTIQRHITKLKYNGLQEVRFGSRSVRFRESSLDRMIRNAAEREEPLFK
jgi:excisionase family DNA binding protein